MIFKKFRLHNKEIYFIMNNLHVSICSMNLYKNLIRLIDKSGLTKQLTHGTYLSYGFQRFHAFNIDIRVM